jgi:putative transposase
MTIFHRRHDYLWFLARLKKASGECGVLVHAFALMSTHFHLVVTPDDVSAIPRAMQKLGVSYVRYFNRTYSRIGTLWNGRYRAKVLDDERYCLTCLRYVDCNPVRAGMTVAPDAYEWSSYRAHAYGRWPDWLKAHPTYLKLGGTADERQTSYRALCGLPLDDAQLATVRPDGSAPSGSAPAVFG